MNKFEELLVEKGLYDEIKIDLKDFAELVKLLSIDSFDYNIDCYCIKCKKERTFKLLKREENQGDLRLKELDNEPFDVPGGITFKDIYNCYLNGRYSLTFRCTRESQHLYYFDLLVTSNTMIKIGQYPSYADITIVDTKKYESVLGERYREYKRALGLFSHGIGIGSFVYLRRIIELLVNDTFNDVNDDIDLDRSCFQQMRFIDKIYALKDYLPSILVRHRNLYGIISKGVHELSEAECLEMFPNIKSGIELILNELIQKKEDEENEKQLSLFVAGKTGELRKR